MCVNCLDELDPPRQKIDGPNGRIVGRVCSDIFPEQNTWFSWIGLFTKVVENIFNMFYYVADIKHKRI
jgi:hypothetical protein